VCMDEIKFRLASGKRIKKQLEKLQALEDVYEAALETYVRKPYGELLEHCINCDKANWEFCLSDKLDYVKDYLNGSKLNANWLTLDINPRQDINLANFVMMVMTYVKKDAFLGAELAFEQRGSDRENCGKGFHVHINLIYGRCKKDLLTHSMKFFKEICSPENINVRQLKLTKELETRKNYIRGIKTAEKMDKVSWDKPFRRENNLADLYIKEGNSIKSELFPY